MEHIVFKYEFGSESDKGFNTHNVESSMADRDDCGLRVDEVCENFVQFMESVGFSVDQVFDYFRE